MKYKFNLNQLHIVNQLIFDTSIDWKDITSLEIRNNKLEIPLERRTFENVVRKKFLFWNITKINGKKSLLSFKEVTDLKIENLKEEFHHNQFLNEVRLDNNTISVYSFYGLIFQFRITTETIVILEDLYKSKFGNGFILRKAGFTANEWKLYLQNNHF